MKTVELFSGTQSFSKIARELKHETFCVDNNKSFNNDLTLEVGTELSKEMHKKITESNIIWMSPPCTTFSMASGNTHWTKERKPKTKKAKEGLNLLKYCKGIATYCLFNNKIFFIENPRARARWFLPKEWRKTVWYCQYGDSRAKPTDIWTNLKEWNPKTCCNQRGDKKGTCHHELAPRGSKTGTQGLKNNMERSVIPPALFHEIFKIIGEKK